MGKEWDLVKEVIILEKDEAMKSLWSKVMYFKPQRQLKGDFMGFSVGGHRGRRYREETKATFENGLFLLTTKRIIWLTKQGLLKKTIQPQYEVKLDELTGVSYKGKITKKLLLSTADRVYEYKMRGADQTVQKIKEQIATLN